MNHTWFQALTGFSKKTPDQVRSNMILKGSTITSRVNGRKMHAGRLEVPTLAELRQRIPAEPSGRGSITVDEVVGDAQSLHTEPEAEGAMFQVASQFNLLEMISPSVTPEDGVSIYSRDPTQGPTCPIAAGAGAATNTH